MGDLNAAPSNLAPAVSPLEVMLHEGDKTGRQDTAKDCGTGQSHTFPPVSHV